MDAALFLSRDFVDYVSLATLWRYLEPIHQEMIDDKGSRKLSGTTPAKVLRQIRHLERIATDDKSSRKVSHSTSTNVLRQLYHLTTNATSRAHCDRTTSLKPRHTTKTSNNASAGDSKVYMTPSQEDHRQWDILAWHRGSVRHGGHEGLGMDIDSEDDKARQAR